MITVLDTAAPTALRPRRSTAQRRTAVLEVAVGVFAEHGYAAPTALIAADAGISEAYLFRLFESKRNLFRACGEALRERTSSVLAAAAHEGGSPAMRLERMRHAYLTSLAPDERRLRVRVLACADTGVRDVARESLATLLDDTARLSGAPPAVVRACVAELLLTDLTEVLELDGPRDTRPSPGAHGRQWRDRRASRDRKQARRRAVR